MRRKSSIRVVTVVAVIGLLVFGFLALMSHLRCDATIYARGFSEAKLRQIRVGMSKAQVQAILGKPLSNDENGHVEGLAENKDRWVYAFLDRSKIPEDDRVTDTWFQMREVDFDANGLVKKTQSSTEQFE